MEEGASPLICAHLRFTTGCDHPLSALNHTIRPPFVKHDKTVMPLQHYRGLLLPYYAPQYYCQLRWFRRAVICVRRIHEGAVNEATQRVYMQAAMLSWVLVNVDIAAHAVHDLWRSVSEDRATHARLQWELHYITACTLLARYCRHVTQQHVSNLCVPVLRSSTECIVLEKIFPECQGTHWYDFLCVA